MNDVGFYFFYSLAHRSELLDSLIVFLSSVFPWIVIVLAFVFLLHHHEIFKSQNPIQEFKIKFHEIAIVFVASITAWVLARVLKILIHTERPFTVFSDVNQLFVDDSFSFPSGHATFFAALAVLIYSHHKKAGIFFGICAVLISLARVAAGVHFPIDILGGLVLGAGIAYFFRKL